MRTVRRNPMSAVFAVLSVAAVAACGAEEAASSGSAVAGDTPGGWEWSAPVKVPGKVNSAANETNPALSADGRTLYFVRNQAQIWVSHWDAQTGGWGDPEALGTCINAGPADNAPSLSADGRRFFFSSNRGGNFDLYVSQRSLDPRNACGWGEPEPLTGVNTGVTETGPEPVQAALGGVTHLYFGRPLTQGDASTFRIFRVPVAHDGTVLGTAELLDELSPGGASAIGPSVSMDRKEIFFHAGTGTGADLVTSTWDDAAGAWATPENLGATVNSSVGDVQPNISRDGRTLLFASTRQGSQGTDLWMTSRSP